MDPTLEKYLRDKKNVVENALKNCFDSNNISPKLLEAMKYSLFSECKRFRPILALASADALGGDENNTIPFACAIELIHTYSLIHDDLPSMDNDDLRRGKATNHKVFGEATAILAGDALLTMAFDVASKPVNGLSPQSQLRIIQLLAESAGHKGMVAGQELDMEGEEKELKIEDIKKIHLHKTAIELNYICIKLYFSDNHKFAESLLLLSFC